MRKWLKRLFCKHKYIKRAVYHKSGFVCISGQQYEEVCAKCGKIGGSYFEKYD